MLAITSPLMTSKAFSALASRLSPALPGLILCLTGLLCGQAACAQGAFEPSGNGERWVEVEVSIFRSTLEPVGFDEVSNPNSLSLKYLPRVKPLTAAASGYAYPFAFTTGLPRALPSGSDNLQQGQGLPALAAQEPFVELPRFSARYSPAITEAFRLPDFGRDPYIALPSDAQQFTVINRKLQSTSEYQLLWHETWRQPLRARAQVPAVAVQAGDKVAGHTELEGSLRVSDTGSGLAQVDVDLWLSRFGAASTGANPWREIKLPAVPVALLNNAPELTPDSALAASTTALRGMSGQTAQVPTELMMLWQQETTRDMGANLLYYLDHPVIGVLIQARPYQLPPIALPDNDQDF